MSALISTKGRDKSFSCVFRKFIVFNNANGNWRQNLAKKTVLVSSVISGMVC